MSATHPLEKLHIVCPHCDAVNRLPSERLGEGGQCGRCRQRLFDGRPAELSEARLLRHLERSDIPVVVDCWAAWCGPCRTMAPIFRQAAAQLEPRLRFAKLDVDAAPGFSGRFGIRSIPTLIVFDRGAELARQAGVTDLGRLSQWLRQVAAR